MTREYQEQTNEYLRGQKVNPIVSCVSHLKRMSWVWTKAEMVPLSEWNIVRRVQGEGYGQFVNNFDAGQTLLCCDRR